MGKRYLDTKKDSLESSILGVWQTAVEEKETRVDGRTKQYKEHRAKLEAARKTRSEKLVGGQKKLDKDKDGDIDGKDFAMLRKEKGKKKVDELTKAQEKLPPALQKAIKKKEKNENFEVGTKARRDHTIETTPGQSKEDFEKQVEVMHKKKNSMREALAKMWGIDEGKNPFDKKEDKKYNKKEGKTLTGKPETKIEIEPKMEKKK